MFTTLFGGSAQKTVNHVEMFKAAGCASALIESVAQNKQVQDLASLYENFTNLLPDIKKQIIEPWMLYCLSGEEAAFEEVKTLFCKQKEEISTLQKTLAALNPEEKKYQQRKGFVESQIEKAQLKLDHFGHEILLLSIASCQPEQIDRTLNLGLTQESIKQSQYALLDAAATGNVKQLEKMLAVEKTLKAPLPRRDKKNRHLLHFAAIHGDENMINQAITVLQKSGMEIKTADQYGYNALDYALVANNQNAIHALKKIGFTSTNDLSHFYFGGLEMADKPTMKPL